MATKKIRSLRVYETLYVVEGMGHFPLDMLRYDSACPMTERDAYIMETYQLTRRVALRSRMLNDNPPNADRWKSFGWVVLGVFGHALEAEEFRDKNAPARGEAGI
jgi:hypothetical protein